MKGLEADALKDPKNSRCSRNRYSNLGSCISSTTYRYDVLNASDASCEADETTCVKYTLEADKEQTGVANYQKTNLN